MTDAISTIPTQSSKSEDWINWHKNMAKRYSRNDANNLFLKAWKLRGSTAANTLDLRNYLKSQGITISESAWDKVVDAGGGVMDFAGNLLNVGKYTGIAIGVIVIGGLGMMVYHIAKDPMKSVGTAIKYAK